MKNKELLYQFLYFACIGATFLNNYELVFAIWIVTIGLTIKKSYSVQVVKYVGFFLAILATALVSGIFRDHPIYNVIRDFTYLAKPILGIWAGYQLCRFAPQKAFKVFIYTGAIVALIHLVIVLITIVSYSTVSLNLIRAKAGYFSDYEIFVLVLLIFRGEFQLEISRSRARWLILIVGLSSFFYLARTNMIQIVILFIALKGYFLVTRRSLKILSTIIVSVLVGYAAIYTSNPKRNGDGLEALLYKIKIAPIEPFKTRINKDDWKDFHDNYRSYENIIAVQQVSREGWTAILFGEGLGATLDLGREVWSNDGEFVRHIPIVHNGYMTVFLKSGILGVFFLIAFIYALSRQTKSEDIVVQHINYLLIGTAIFLIFSNWVFLGLYLKLDNKSVIIGFLIALRQIIQKQNTLLKTHENQ